MTTKKSILTLFESNRSQHISGEQIAQQLGISRNAVWKAVKELIKDGYKIGASTNKGYCFVGSNDVLSEEGILPFLKNHENINIKIYDELESTNKTAKEMAISDAQHGTVVIANYQTAGRGRFGRKFFSPRGYGVYMSFILRPERLNVDTPTLVTAFAAVAVCEAIESISGKTPQIKWVNDIFLDRKKICGILTEAVTDFESGSIDWVVVGIGVNLSLPDEELPDEIKNVAGAVFSGENTAVTRNHLIGEIINCIMATSKDDNLLKKYKNRLMMLGETVLVNEATKSYDAVALDIDEIGRLVVQKSDGEVSALSSGEIGIKMKNV